MKTITDMPTLNDLSINDIFCLRKGGLWYRIYDIQGVDEYRHVHSLIKIQTKCPGRKTQRLRVLAKTTPVYDFAKANH